MYQAGRGIVLRFVARRQRTAKTATLHVLLTRQGDLAWASGTSGQRPHGDVVLERPGKPARRLDDEAIEGFKLEDDRTLVWSDYYELYFFDLRRKPCPNRSRYKVLARNDRFIVTSARYPDGFTDGAMTVYRGCDRKTGHDRVLASSTSEENAAPDNTFEIDEITGSWVTFLEGSYSPYGSSYDFTDTNVINGRRTYCVIEPDDGAVITNDGTVAWIDDSTVRVCLGEKYDDVDSGGTLTNLHVEGNTVVWAHDGLRRTYSHRPDGQWHDRVSPAGACKPTACARLRRRTRDLLVDRQRALARGGTVAVAQAAVRRPGEEIGMRRWLDRGVLTVAVTGVFAVAGAPAQAQLGTGTLGAITEFPTASGSRPLAIVAGRDGALWFTQIGANRIGRMTTDGVLTNEWTVPTPNSQPDGIAIGPDGSVWFAEVIGNKIGRLMPGGSIVEYPVPTADSRPTEVAVGTDGRVWFTERGTAAAPGDKIGKVDPSTGSVTEYDVRTDSRPLGIVAGPDGNIWFTQQAGNRVGRISTAGVLLNEYEMPQPNSSPFEPTVGPDGAIWFTQITGNRIGRLTVDGALTEYTVPTPASQPNVIASGPDPNPAQSKSLWFAETVGNKIGRITTTGVVTEFPIPSANAQPVGLAAGPDGHVWFAESAAATGNRIGRLWLTMQVPAPGGVGGTVPATLAMSLGTPASFGSFTPGTARTYDASMTANVISTAADATLSLVDPSSTATGHLVNGSFSLTQPLMAKASSVAGSGRAYAPVGSSPSPATLLTYAGPVSNDAVTLSFQQAIGASEALRTGSYAKTLTFTLSTTTP